MIKNLDNLSTLFTSRVVATVVALERPQWTEKMSNSGSPLMALVIFVVMGLFTLWFGGLMLRAVDILYKPSVKKWMQNRPVWQHHHHKQKPLGKNDLLKVKPGLWCNKCDKLPFLVMVICCIFKV